MKTSSFIAIILFFVGSIHSFLVYSQDESSEELTLDNLRPPTSPAFSILNLGTESVTRPTTPSGLATTLLSGFNGTALAPNLALEVAPYWLKPRRTLSFEEYYGIGDQKPMSIWSTVSFSLATTKLGEGKDTLDGTRLGWGARGQIKRGKIPDRIMHYIDTIDTYDALFAAVRLARGATSLEDLKTKTLVLAHQLIDSNPAYAADSKTRMKNASAIALENAMESIDSMGVDETKENLQKFFLDKEKYALAIQDLDKNRVGFIWEVSLAGVQYFPDNSVDNSAFQKLGLWSTITYRFEDKDIAETGKNEASFLLRFALADSDSITTNVDLGIGYHRIPSKDFNYGLEVLLRYYETRYDTQDQLGNDIRAVKEDFTWRLLLNLEYKLSDQIVLSGGIGKDFDGPFKTTGNLLALLGLNFSLPNTSKLKM